MNLDATRKRRNTGSRTVITMIMIIGVAVNKLEVFGPFSIAAVGDLSVVYRASASLSMEGYVSSVVRREHFMIEHHTGSSLRFVTGKLYG